MRKTHTSTEVKRRWIRANYDRIMFDAGKGTNDLIKELAEQSGSSKAMYLKRLIVADAMRAGRTDAPEIVGTGGGGT